MRFGRLIPLVAALCAPSCGSNATTAKTPPAANASQSTTQVSIASPDADLLEITALGLRLRLADAKAWSQSIDASGWTVLKKGDTVFRLTKTEETSMIGSAQCELRAQWVGEAPNDRDQKRRHFEERSAASSEPSGGVGRPSLGRD